MADGVDPASALTGGVSSMVNGLFSYFGARAQANASKEAARIQAASADRALAEQRRIFDLQRSDREPYVDVSLGALGNLQHLAAQPQYMQLPAQRLGASSPTMPQARPTAPVMPGNLGQLGQPQSAPATGQAMGVFRAPDGSTRQMPLAMEQELAAKRVMRIQ